MIHLSFPCALSSPACRVLAVCPTAFFETAANSRNDLRGGFKKSFVCVDFITEVYFFGRNLSLRQLTKTS